MTTWARKPALDGLRAVALAFVLLSHAGVGVVGGAIGVDVFLVLSGYLITGLLLVELDRDGRIDLRAFWARRARRLVPAALALVAVVGLVARPDGLDTIASLGWWANWRFALADAGYFDAFATPSPLRHTWSLAVEEQWYLLWPPLLLAAHRLGGRRLALAVTGALTLASAAAMWLVAADVDRAHMGTDTRAQGLLVGAALALWLHGRALPRRGTTTAAVAAGALLVAVAWRVPGTEAWLYRGGHLAVAAASGAVVLAALRVEGPVRRVLAVRPLQAVGRVSYGAYLWHWPLFVWLTPDRTGLDPWPLLAVRLAATAAATLLSWHLVERPLLDGRPLPRPRLALPAAVATACTLVVATIALDPSAQPGGGRDGASAAPTLPAGYTRSTTTSREPPRPTLLDTAPAPRPPDRGGDGAPGDPVVTVVGDSSAWALGWQVEPVEGVEVYDGGMIGCGVDPAAVLVNGAARVETGQPVPCTQSLDLWTWWVARSDPDLVVVTVGAWEVYDRVLEDGTRLDVGTDRWERWLGDGVDRVLLGLAAHAPHARIAITEVPCYAERDLALGGPSSPRNDPDRVAAVNELLGAVVAEHPERLVWLPWSGWLCGSDEYHRPDGVHLDPPSARALWAGPLGEWVRELLSAPVAG